MDIKRGMEVESKVVNRLTTFHCKQCNTVLGDSLGVCGELRSIDSFLCARVTHDVLVSDDVELMANCICSSLQCCGCRCVVGAVVHSAPQHLDALRSVFLLYKANISCYILDSSSMVKASTLTFDVKLIESIEEMKRQFQVQIQAQVSAIEKRMAERSTTRMD